RIEDLDARFPELDDFRDALAAKRAEVEDAFAARRQHLLDERVRHTTRLMESSGRILDSARRRATAFRTLDDIDAYFAADPLLAKVRRTITELHELGEQVGAEELESRLKAARQHAARALRDRTELSGDDSALVRLGRHRFAVTTQTANLTLAPHDDGMAFALTSTDYRRPVTDPDFTATRRFWTQTLPSESPQVYRAEYLAGRLLAEHDVAALGETDLASLVRRTAESAPDEGYERGVHDHDAHLILAALLRLRASVGLLRYPSAERAAAQLLWSHGEDPRIRQEWQWRARSLARARDAFGPDPAIDALRTEIALALRAFADRHDVLGGADPDLAADYLFEEIATTAGGFVSAGTARTLVEKFRHSVGDDAYADDLKRITGLVARRQLVEAWLGSYAAASGEPVAPGDLAEAVAIELSPDLPRYPGTAETHETVGGLLGSHPRIDRGRLSVRIDELLTRTRDFHIRHVPAFRAYQVQRRSLITMERDRLRIDEHRAAVPTTFVRNRLIDEVYLPLIGDNLAKQLGAAGTAKRTDNHGLLLLISPPGYGKTTLVEYVAERLGLLLVKVDGPALGHAVTSLDPAEAPNATARREVEKINFALEAGNNVLLYLDDIQHTSPELLQKFIPLCDAQRRIAGVRDGQAHTHDLRGKRFAVVMSGNPYTEAGRAFRVPDMLANRADVWNLGDVLAGRQDVFALSFIENALTSSPVLATLADRGRGDLDLLLRWARHGEAPRPDLLGHACPPAELDRILAVLRKLLAARDTVLTVNRAYMDSAAQADESRTEPPFRLQGSYRNMNRIAERVQPAMNHTELDAVITDHYTAEAQTLAGDAEANLLKLGEIRGLLTTEQAARWHAIKAACTATPRRA
ncbi:MAG: ATP-binding protein, partial [Streptomycetaceae bacterium]|nr:ATP-binding protein [Streptomycetaceae bacterium]